MCAGLRRPVQGQEPRVVGGCSQGSGSVVMLGAWPGLPVVLAALGDRTTVDLGNMVEGLLSLLGDGHLRLGGVHL